MIDVPVRSARGRPVRPTATLVALCLLALPACQQEMATQPAPRPLASSDFFADGRASRPVVPGTVARGQERLDTALETGRDDDGKVVTLFPFEMTRPVLERGKQRYEIFCSVCHGLTGHGDGRIVKRGFTSPPDYVTGLSRAYQLKGQKVQGQEVVTRKQELKLVDVPVGHVFEVITKGYGAMPDHAAQIPVRDRWAITGYVRALQYAQSPELRQKVKTGGKP